MARNEARIFTSIWKDKAFLALPPSAQRLYMFLLSQPDLAYCGVISLRPRRWARTASELTAKEIEADLEVLAKPVPMPVEAFREGLSEGFPEEFAKPFLVVDEETEEVLVRSFIRRDEVWKQPNLMKAAREAAEPIESPEILAALLDELRRIPAAGSTSDHVRKAHAGFVADLEKALGDQGDDREEGYGEGSQKGSADPSQEKGGGNGSSTGTSSLLSPDSDPPSSTSEDADGASDANEGRDDVERLCAHLADRIEQNGSARPNIGKKWRDAARLMIDRDKRTEEQVHRAIDWCQDHEFWRSNVLSMPKLRDQYDQLRLQAETQRGRASPAGHLNGSGPRADVNDVDWSQGFNLGGERR